MDYKNLKTISLILGVLICTFCNTSCIPEGCKDLDATNFDSNAVRDCCCEYSTAVFYGSQFSPFPPVVVSVDGITIGNLEAAYPSGPGNCSVPGVAKYEFDNSDAVDWVAIDANGFIFSGRIRPSSSDCIKVRVF